MRNQQINKLIKTKIPPILENLTKPYKMSTNPINGFVYEKGAELLIDTQTNKTK